MKNATHGKGKTGLGGIRCACCTKGTAKDVKKATARWNRKRAKKEIASL